MLRLRTHNKSLQPVQRVHGIRSKHTHISQLLTEASNKLLPNNDSHHTFKSKTVLTTKSNCFDIKPKFSFIRKYSSKSEEEKEHSEQTDSDKQQTQDEEKQERQENRIDTQARAGPFRWSEALVVMSLMVAIVYFVLQTYQKSREQAELEEKKLSSVGRPDLGGPFELYNTKGQKVTDQDFRGKWMFLYFGFTNCPDICPAELDKMTKALHSVDKYLAGDIVPVFISVDPDRDSSEVIEKYLEDFHPRFVGLTGPKENIKAVTKEYRVYYSEPSEKEVESADYLVDHSIIMYLMDPEGNFVEYYTNRHSAEDIAFSLIKHVKGEVV